MNESNCKNVDVLSLEWATSPSRDRISATLVCNYLRLQGATVQDGSIYDGLNTIQRFRPRLLFLTNTTGAAENFETMRYAKKRGILGASLVSEGIFKSNYLNQMIWGWNTDKILYEDINLQWSNTTKNMTLDLHPELIGRIKVSGGVGFDSYQVSNNQEAKRKILSKYDKCKYSKVIGVGCWDFGWLYSEDTRFTAYSTLFDPIQKERFKKDADAFDDALVQLANENPETLFLLKQHPGNQLGHRASGITKASNLKNTLVLMNEESIVDCIQTSDLWIVYESTTAMEAWLLGKTTLLLNPSGRDFPRDRLSDGSPDYPDAVSLGNAIRDFYIRGVIPTFEELNITRTQLIAQHIQWCDGLNHVRAGNAILNLLQQKPQVSLQRESCVQMTQRWLQHARWLFKPLILRTQYFKNSYANRKNFDFSELNDYTARVLEDQLAFYRSQNLSLQQLRQILPE